MLRLFFSIQAPNVYTYDVLSRLLLCSLNVLQERHVCLPLSRLLEGVTVRLEKHSFKETGRDRLGSKSTSYLIHDKASPRRPTQTHLQCVSYKLFTINKMWQENPNSQTNGGAPGAKKGGSQTIVVSSNLFPTLLFFRAKAYNTRIASLLLLFRNKRPWRNNLCQPRFPL